MCVCHDSTLSTPQRPQAARDDASRLRSEASSEAKGLKAREGALDKAGKALDKRERALGEREEKLAQRRDDLEALNSTLNARDETLEATQRALEDAKRCAGGAAGRCFAACCDARHASFDLHRPCG